jgi:hypothetical protein
VEQVEMVRVVQTYWIRSEEADGISVAAVEFWTAQVGR